MVIGWEFTILKILFIQIRCERNGAMWFTLLYATLDDDGGSGVAILTATSTDNNNGISHITFWVWVIRFTALVRTLELTWTMEVHRFSVVARKSFGENGKRCQSHFWPENRISNDFSFVDNSAMDRFLLRANFRESQRIGARGSSQLHNCPPCDALRYDWWWINECGMTQARNSAPIDSLYLFHVRAFAKQCVQHIQRRIIITLLCIYANVEGNVRILHGWWCWVSIPESRYSNP